MSGRKRIQLGYGEGTERGQGENGEVTGMATERDEKGMRRDEKETWK